LDILTHFPVASTSEQRASVKRFVSFQFLNPKTVDRTPWTGDQPIARPFKNLVPTGTQIPTPLPPTVANRYTDCAIQALLDISTPKFRMPNSIASPLII
jgi:hypothetical protein